MQFSTLVAITLAASVNALPAGEEATVTLTNFITKVVSQHTTYVPMAVTFLANVQNTTQTNSTSAVSSAANNSTAVSSAAKNSTASHTASSTSGAAANAAPIAGVAGLSAIVGAAALLL